MAKYDFTTVVKRVDSSKWLRMLELNPAVDRDVIPLSVADMEFVLAPEIKNGLQEYLDYVVLGYSQPSPAYLSAVRKWMQERHDFAVSAEQIVPISGIVPALYQAVQSFTEPGDGVIVMSPVYYPFFMAIENSGRRIENCPLFLRDGRYRMDLELLAKMTAGTKNKLLLFCSPHNPAGRVWERRELEGLADITLKNELIVVSDEIHHDLVLPGHRHTVFQTLSPELAQRVITCTAPSKTFNIAGMAVSNLVIVNSELRDKFSLNLAKTGFRGSTILSYKACELAYEHCGGWLDELMLVIKQNEELVRNFFARHCPEVNIVPLEGTYLLWVDLSSWGMTIAEQDAFLEQEAQFFTNHGHIFGSGGEGFERINLALPTAALSVQLERLHAAMRKRGLC
ncbi:MAG: MalY/PatB family protein [Saccharofermentanales bacterium]|mgnify:CR=1 FL=1|nr:MalY/PatB family protein [Bacillota bacterium]